MNNQMDDFHYHVCERCGKEFGHIQPEGLSDPEFYDAHKCQTCKSGPYLRKYTSQVEAARDAVCFIW